MEIDIEKLRKDIIEECYGAFFGGGFGGAMVEAGDAEKASPEELIEIAERNGFKLKDYIV